MAETLAVIAVMYFLTRRIQNWWLLIPLAILNGIFTPVLVAHIVAPLLPGDFHVDYDSLLKQSVRHVLISLFSLPFLRWKANKSTSILGSKSGKGLNPTAHQLMPENNIRTKGHPINVASSFDVNFSANLANHPHLREEDKIYERIGKELEHGQKDLGLWTRAYAEADGNEDKVKATYIRLRCAFLLEQDAKVREFHESEQIADTAITEPVFLKNTESLASSKLGQTAQEISHGTNDSQRGPLILNAASRGALDEVQSLARASPLLLYFRDRENRDVLTIAKTKGHLELVSWIEAAISKSDFSKLPLCSMADCKAPIESFGHQISGPSGGPWKIRKADCSVINISSLPELIAFTKSLCQ
jgi:hypothetical protein